MTAVTKDPESRAPADCVNGCARPYSLYSGPGRVSTTRPSHSNAWAGPEYMVENQQTSHERSFFENGQGGGLYFRMDDRAPFGPAPVLRAPWGDVDEFPGEDEAWQSNPHNVNHMINRGMDAVAAAKDVLRKLYGPFYDNVAKVGDRDMRGLPSFIGKESFEGTVQRLLHAMMTSAPFTIVLAGHSATQASGNFLNQSSIHYLHSILGPPLAAVGVQLVTRNHAMGGLSSVHRSACFATAYGADTDVIMWDYGMTAGSPPEMDYFFRQAMLQPRRPLLVAFQEGSPKSALKDVNLSRTKFGPYELLESYSRHGYHVAGVPGSMKEWTAVIPPKDGIPPYATTSAEQAQSLPPGIRHLFCETDDGRATTDSCRLYKYDCHCWDDWDAEDAPPLHKANCKGQASWHPGWRSHRIRGHMAAALFLVMVDTALTRFQEQVAVNPLPLNREMWHLSPLIDRQAAAVKAIQKDSILPCKHGHGPGLAQFPGLGCDVTYNCATEFFPSVGPTIRDLMAEPKTESNWVLDTGWMDGNINACPGKTIGSNVRGFMRGNSSWFVLRLIGVRDGVFVFSPWGVAGTPFIWWGEQPTRNCDLKINGKIVTAGIPLNTDKDGNASGPTMARVANMEATSTVELALRMLGGRQRLLSHVLWR